MRTFYKFTIKVKNKKSFMRAGHVLWKMWRFRPASWKGPSLAALVHVGKRASGGEGELGKLRRRLKGGSLLRLRSGCRQESFKETQTFLNHLA